MKHIRNSIKGVYFLEHKGVPTATLTDFAEPIANGSLCVDRNNQNLYILKANVWTLFSIGISGGDFIPLAGTESGNPVTGNIEMSDFTALERGSNQIIFTNEGLIFHFTDNDGDLVNDGGVTMNQNIIFQMDAAIATVDDNSKSNFIYKVDDTLNIEYSNNNTIFAKSIDINGSNFNNNTILGEIGNLTINNSDSNILNSISTNNSNNILNNVNNTLLINETSNSSTIDNINSSIILGKNFTVKLDTIDNSFINMKSNTIGMTTNIKNVNFSNINTNQDSLAYSNIIDNLSYSTIYAKHGSLSIEDSIGLNIISEDFSYSGTNSNYIEFLGILNDEGVNKSYFKDSSFNKFLGNFFNMDLNDSNYNNFQGNISKLTTTVNEVSYTTVQGSFNNLLMISPIGHNNIYGEYDDLLLYGNYNFLHTSFDSGNLTLRGDSNYILINSINSTSGQNIEFIGNNNYLIGDIKIDNENTFNIYNSNNNTIFGKVNINNSLTNNNIIIGGKEISNINHDVRDGNIFLNVSNFTVKHENSIYLPCEFHTVSNGNIADFNSCNITNDRTWVFPDKSGTVALLEDVINGTAGVATNMVDTTYEQLVYLSNTSGLTEGVFYRFEYQTIHQIPNTSEIHVGEIEQLIAMATSSSTINKRVWSNDYPQDLIQYDINSNLAEDFSTSRPGFITYRMDRDKNNYTWYDFRNVMYRRWDISSTLNDTWSSGSNFTVDNVVISSDSIYKCIKDHISSGSINLMYFTLLFPSITSYKYLWDDTSVNIGGAEIYAGTNFVDYLTFTPSECRNVNIGRYDNTFNNIVLYGNIIAGTTTFCNDIKIDDNCYNMTISGAFIEVETGCYDLWFGSRTGRIYLESSVNKSIFNNNTFRINVNTHSTGLLLLQTTNTNILQNCDNITIFNSDNINIHQDSSYIRLADSNDDTNIDSACENIYIYGYNNNINIGNSSNNIDILSSGNSNIDIHQSVSYISITSGGTSYLTIGTSSNNLTFQSNNQITIGKNCSNIDLNSGSQNINIDNDCSNLIIDSGCSYLNFGLDCSNIHNSSGSSYNNFGNLCSNIILNNSNSYNTFNTNCTNITLGSGSSYNTFGMNCNYITLSNGSSHNEFTNDFDNKIFNQTINNLKFLISDSLSKTYINSHSNSVVNMKDSGNDLWYQTIDTLGSITTVKLT